MDLTFLPQLQPVLDIAEPSVRGCKAGPVVICDVAAVDESVQGIERVATADPRIASPVNQLQQLDGELDVPDATRAKLHVIVRLMT